MRQVIRLADCITVFALIAWLLLGVLPEHRSHIFARRLHHIPKVGKILAEMWRAVFLYRRRWLAILAALSLTLVSQILNVIAFFLASLAFQPVGGTARIPGLVEHFVLVPAGTVFQAFIPTPGGIGGAEWLYSAFYWGFGYPGEGGVLGSLGTRLVQWILGFAGHVVYLFMKREIPVTPASDQILTGSNLPRPVSSTTKEL